MDSGNTTAVDLEPSAEFRAMTFLPRISTFLPETLNLLGLLEIWHLHSPFKNPAIPSNLVH